MIQLKPEIINQIQQKAEDKYPFQWPKNKKGEAIEQRVGQNPVGWRKHQNIVKAYIAGAEEYALKWQQAEEMVEKMASLLNEAMIPISQNSTKEAEALLRSIKKELAEFNTYKKASNDSTNR